ncbi:HtaA domain-containing protein [Arthrobacter sp. KNU-44]|uniref:HtaA domain-containing protein n=1 Tax=Arthrobacter sp. KNU-44 TaxID=3450744 RepID=UPI003F4325AE
MNRLESDEANGYLLWPVKKSFREYIAALEDGSETVEGGAVSADGGFVFAECESTGFTDDGSIGTIRYGGGVSFSGYGGMLSTRLFEPWFEIDGQQARMSVQTRGGSHPARQVIATCELPLPETTTELVVWRDAVPLLTFEGVSLFGDVYQPGSALDCLTLSRGRRRRETTQADG